MLNPIILLIIFTIALILLAITAVFSFRYISSVLIKNNHQAFLDLANSNFEKREQAIDYLVKPLKESLEKFDHKIQEIEKTRAGAYAGLSEQVKSLLESQLQLKSETNNLVNALRKPQVRGRWGEIQLQRVVELAGMLENCDFYQQQSTTDYSNADNSINQTRLRPDLMIKLPGGKNIIVDAKVPLLSFLESLENTNNEAMQKQKLLDHARHIRDHIKKLSQKNYWEQFNPTPEFVILFLPGETFFSAALEVDPALIELGVEQQVIIATPTTLIALLKAIAYGWRQDNLAQNAAQISELGKELSKRLSLFGENFSAVGDKLEKTIESYNKLIGTFESRILVTARKFQSLSNYQHNNNDHNNTASNLETLSPIALSPRKLVNSIEKEIIERD